jgi:hypothetical protein
MITRITMALGLAVALLSSGFAGSANAAKKPVVHHHVMPHKVHGHSSSPMSGADMSADSLNAQSLTRAQGGQ